MVFCANFTSVLGVDVLVEQESSYIEIEPYFTLIGISGTVPSGGWRGWFGAFDTTTHFIFEGTRFTIVNGITNNRVQIRLGSGTLIWVPASRFGH